MPRPAPTPVVRPCRSSEGGFTLVELLVAMVLFAIVMTLVVQVMARSFGSATGSSVSQQSQSQVTKLVDQLGQDIRSARAPQHGLDFAADPTVFEHAVQSGGVQNGKGPWVYGDVIFAGALKLQLNDDVVPGGPPECVNYSVVGGGGSWKLVRTVYTRPSATASCTLATQYGPATTVLGPTPGTAPARVFSYTLQHGPPGGTACTTTSWAPTAYVNGNDPRLFWITSVTLDLDSTLVRADQASRTQLRDTFSIRGRQGYEYMSALGCA